MEALRARIQSSGLSCAEQAALAPLNPNHIKMKVYNRVEYILGAREGLVKLGFSNWSPLSALATVPSGGFMRKSPPRTAARAIA